MDKIQFGDSSVQKQYAMLVDSIDSRELHLTAAPDSGF
jgi:hypothetical protein